MSDYAFVTGINSFLQQLPGSAISRLSCTHLAKNLGRPAVDHRGQDGRRYVGLTDHKQGWSGDWRRLYR